MKLENVSFTYSPNTAYEIHALKNINLEIREGEFIGLIGHTQSQIGRASCRERV